MNAKIIASMVAISAAAAVAGGATIAYFSDQETATGNTFTAGSLDMQVAANNGSFVSAPVNLATVTNMAPGQVVGPYVLKYKNIGSVSGKIKVSVSYVQADDETEDGKSTNEYASVNSTNPEAVDLTADEYAKLLIVANAQIDLEGDGNAASDVQYWWARQIIADKYLGNVANALAAKAIVEVGGTSPDTDFDSRNFAPTVFGLRQVAAFKLTNGWTGPAIEVTKNQVYSTSLTLKLDENADNKSQFDGNTMTLTATMNQFTDTAAWE